MIYLDTHIVVWLYDGLIDKLSKKAQHAIENNALKISAMVKLELQFLYEINRIRINPETILHELTKTIDLSITQSNYGFHQIVENALDLQWTRDPFDRIIVAEAMIDNVDLVTKDQTILQHYTKALW